MPRGINQYNKDGRLPKEDKAALLVGAGMTFSQAMQSTGLTDHPHTSALIKLRKAREGFMREYVAKIKKKGLGAEKIVDRLSRIIAKDQTDKQDFNAVQAIKVHVGIMSRVADPQVVNQINGVFIAPQVISDDSWRNAAALALRPAEIETVTDANDCKEKTE